MRKGQPREIFGIRHSRRENEPIRGHAKALRRVAQIALEEGVEPKRPENTAFDRSQ
jgi:hypothetical protein